VVTALINGLTVFEMEGESFRLASREIKKVWNSLCEFIN